MSLLSAENSSTDVQEHSVPASQPQIGQRLPTEVFPQIFEHCLQLDTIDYDRQWRELWNYLEEITDFTDEFRQAAIPSIHFADSQHDPETVLRACIASIPEDLEESARLDTLRAQAGSAYKPRRLERVANLRLTNRALASIGAGYTFRTLRLCDRREHPLNIEAAYSIL